MARSMRRASGGILALLLVVGGAWLAQSRSAPGQPAPEAGPAQPQPQAKPAPSNDPPRSPLLRALHDAIEQAKDWDGDFGDRDELKKSLRDADGTLERIRRENAKGLSLANRQPPTRNQPNLVVIVLDDLPRDHLGCYGQKTIQTPMIDRLAARGTRFTRFHAGSGDAAARFSLLTGRFAQPGGQFMLSPNETPTARVLWRAGYSTAWFGECRLEDPGAKINPSDYGFEEWYGTWDQPTSVYPEKLVRLGKPVDIPENADGKRGAYINALYTREASAWIRQFDRPRAQRPFFLQITYRVPGKDWEAPIIEPYASTSWSPTTKAWASLVTGVDREIEKVIQALRDAQQLNNTLIFVTADQRRAAAPGDEVFEVQSPAEESEPAGESGVMVPLVTYGYGRVAAKLATNTPASLLDLPPTLAAWANHSRGSTSFGGHSLSDTLSSRPAASDPSSQPGVVAPGEPVGKPGRRLPQIIRGRP